MKRTAPDALLLGVQAQSAEPRQTHDGMWQSLVEGAWQRSQDAAAAGQPAEALLWLERAHRMAPGSGVFAAALAGAWLQAGDPARAAALFKPLANRDGMPEAWAGLAASHRMLGEVEQAVEAMAAAAGAAVRVARSRRGVHLDRLGSRGRRCRLPGRLSRHPHGKAIMHLANTLLPIGN